MTETALANAITDAIANATPDETTELSIDTLTECWHSNVADLVNQTTEKKGSGLKAKFTAIGKSLGELMWDIHKNSDLTPVDAVIYVFQTPIKQLVPKLVDQFNPKIDVQNAKPSVTRLVELTAPLMTAMENVDDYSQAKMLQNIGRGLLNAIGWNRAFYENVLYGSYTAARDFQAESIERDDTGVFIGAYAPEELDEYGRPIQSLRDTLSPKQQLLLDELELKEGLLVDAVAAAKEAFAEIQGEKTPFISPFKTERAAGIRTIEQIIEDQKLRAIQWHIDQEEAEAQRQVARRKALNSATRVVREKRTELLNETLA